MINRNHKLPLSRQGALLRQGRGSLYYAPRPVPSADLAAMRRIDELHLNYPFEPMPNSANLLELNGPFNT